MIHPEKWILTRELIQRIVNRAYPMRDQKIAISILVQRLIDRSSYTLQWVPLQHQNAPVASVVGSTQTPRSLVATVVATASRKNGDSWLFNCSILPVPLLAPQRRCTSLPARGSRQRSAACPCRSIWPSHLARTRPCYWWIDPAWRRKGPRSTWGLGAPTRQSKTPWKVEIIISWSLMNTLTNSQSLGLFKWSKMLTWAMLEPILIWIAIFKTIFTPLVSRARVEITQNTSAVFKSGFSKDAI